MAAHGNTIMSGHTQDKVTKAKVTIETFYSNLMNQQVEREERLSILERTMKDDDLPIDEVKFLMLLFSGIFQFFCFRFRETVEESNTPSKKQNF